MVAVEEAIAVQFSRSSDEVVARESGLYEFPPVRCGPVAVSSQILLN
jgi:hypothetical protein